MLSDSSKQIKKEVEAINSDFKTIVGCGESKCPKLKRLKLASTPDIILKVMIEIPKGSQNKYEYDKERKVIKFDRMLFSAVHYPSDYGFIEDTLAEDGDPLDALVLVWEPTFPGCLIETKPVGLFKMYDEKGPDAKLLCVPIGDPHFNFIRDLSDVPPHLLKEIFHFFNIYKELEAKKTGVEGWEDRESAIKTYWESHQRYLDSLKNKPEQK
ncbi:MAG: inorganic diphosphatase [Dehalococcoides mccartyi]|jgi:Inorganic pyrophosphatase|uniref:Inorganic pyrophosphatase n=3 Tax=root TaxID=1 RepID=A0A0V8M4V2_9CHLR|nr:MULTISPECIES: inorganic diphosphatase [Dehalococcoides]AAW40363.1 inorganic pyrophosphatase [Dehalococcoides mccartyi 195]AII59059.1 inorganic pyrophosphatase [Dehalococcoides mccartyi CG4]AQU02762.1 inorganic pyrophosphatase [Dehalococcoides mccartyi]AQU04089.1 inorganic pyrophosphatase [Dehalococcoides mccartyi]KSV18813.1 inorganic pyrophosphatase [Dehalococcoides mccartyi]